MRHRSSCRTATESTVDYDYYDYDLIFRESKSITEYLQHHCTPRIQYVARVQYLLLTLKKTARYVTEPYIT